MGQHTGNRRCRPLGWVGTVMLWLVILATTGAITLAVLVPQLGGATPYTILTGSMRPGLPPGTLVVARPAAVDQIGVGTVITYQLESGKPTVVTHRVVSAGTTVEGKHVFTTKGDANDAVDQRPVMPVQVRGRLWYSVPYLGYASTVVTGQQRHFATMLVVAGLLVYAAYMLLTGLREQLRSRAARRRRTGIVAPSVDLTTRSVLPDGFSLAHGAAARSRPSQHTATTPRREEESAHV